MASTYTTNQGLEKPATGDRSGTWGTMTNTNMDMLDRAISGVGALSLTGTTTTLTTSDGSASDGNYKVLILGGSPSGTNTITLSPNDADKLYFVVNASGESVIFTQGSGANVTIANGAADIIYADGAGAGAAVSSYLANDFVFKTGDGVILNLQTSDTTVTASSVLGRLNFTAPNEGSGTDAILLAASIAAISEGTFAANNNATKLSFMTGASEAASEKMSLSSGGNLTLPTDGVVIATGADSDVLLTHVADTGLTMSVTGNNVAQLSVTTDKDTAAVGPVFNLTRYSASPADADGGGIIQFVMENDNNQLWTAAQIYSVATDVTDTEEDGKLVINTMKAGTSTTALTISDTGIQVPDGGNVGSVTSPTAIDILGTGEIGIGIAGNASHQTYIYDNTTGRTGLRVQLDNASSTNTGIYATTDGAGIAVYGSCAGAHWGVYGLSAAHYGVYGKTQSASHGGVFGISADSSEYAILGYQDTYGVWTTSLTSGATKSFQIPHGLREGYDLVHSSIEGPLVDLIYRGSVDLVEGRAEISIDTKFGFTPGTFEWLTKNPQTFTSNETGWDAVKSSFSGDTITIECQNTSSTDTISWMVVAERDDPNIRATSKTDSNGHLIVECPSVEPPPPPPPPED
jgi:hypothetical protein